MNNLAERVACLCCDKYDSLKKTGKPKENEWTVLAGIVLKDSTQTLSVISLATGTKCLSGTELMDVEKWECGSRLSDSHAEVLARRAFQRYLYNQLDLVLRNKSSNIFEHNESRKIILKENVSFHYFCSQTPCGDCSIFPQTDDELVPTDESCVKRRRIDIGEARGACTLTSNVASRESNTYVDIHRTGAKCVSTEKEQDLYHPGLNYHVIGPLRIKPGRGDRTLSMSCSDKLAKWNAIGIQGALLSRLVPPIRIDTICIGGQCPFSEAAMRRGVHERFADVAHCPDIVQSEKGFAHRKQTTRTQPCPSSIIWCAVPGRQLEVSVDGRKQGVTKKKARGNYLTISRRELFSTFLKIVDEFDKIENGEKNHPKKITYYHAKQSSTTYQRSWQKLKFGSFQAWPDKPTHLQEFVLF
ncbi:tRNA-specific adenosine deaminase 1 [Athalia rosae]|uniref:tRNA-specific adenosine deaminase 1 n=1 Tax=Athalia rosae TaxID=37344 RepID=UPI002033CFC1|nr:tRNA-specific adenosine deaminase 1 [Athalia rosae]